MAGIHVFNERRILTFYAPFSVKAGYEIVPKPAAQQLVAYLRSLQSSTPLFELPSLTPSTNKVEMTNAPAANATNAPATNAPATTNPPAK